MSYIFSGCVRACTYVCASVLKCVCVFVHMRVCLCVCVHACILYVCVRAHVRACVRVCVRLLHSQDCVCWAHIATAPLPNMAGERGFLPHWPLPCCCWARLAQLVPAPTRLFQYGCTAWCWGWGSEPRLCCCQAR